jgi:pimeloyl-ACP methyl ester carboxylesterase
MSDDLRSVMAATGAHQPVLVGWSLGGIIVAQYLSDYGDGDISGVNFVGARIAKPPGQNARMPGARYVRTMLSKNLETNIRATANFVRACVTAPLAPEDFELMLGYNMASPVFARVATLKWSGGTDFAAALPRIKVPVLISHGRRDQVISPAVAEEAGRIIPTAKVSWYEDAGHALFFEDAARFNAELAAFVDAADAAKR